MNTAERLRERRLTGKGLLAHVHDSVLAGRE
jgi:hypothetical protein